MSATKRRKRVHVGWYCNHEDEPYGERTHMSTYGKWKRQKWVETWPEPNTTSSMTHLDYREPKKRPACPRALPVYIYKEADA